MDQPEKNSMESVTELLKKGAAEGIYPGAVLLVAREGEVVFFKETGYVDLSSEHVPTRKDTIFDLASLTKPLAATLAIMRLVDQEKIGLDQTLLEIITTSPLKDKGALTPRMILSHCAGLTDWKPFYLDLVNVRPEKRKKYVRKSIVQEPLVYSPAKACVYSDLGFMILEWVVEEVSGMPLKSFLELNFYNPLLLKRTFLNTGVMPGQFKKEDIAPTGHCGWRKRIIQGEVHDENAHALGGYSGHSGLFGDAEEVLVLVNMLKEHYRGERDDYLKPYMVKEFFTRQEIVDGCTWALGWDTPSARDSSSGKYFSRNSVGHLGFTGTSVWMELEKDIIIIFLTNRVHTTRTNEGIKRFRPMLHDLIMEKVVNGLL
jgi:CubicO group peptidase (beta-lactamase class C family)